MNYIKYRIFTQITFTHVLILTLIQTNDTDTDTDTNSITQGGAQLALRAFG